MSTRRINISEQLGKVGVLMGGTSTEREISLKSGNAVYDSLKSLNLDVVAVDIKTEDVQENKRLLQSQNINCAFLALHGRFGEDGQIQEILDSLNIPYTGSGPQASRLAMDKIASKKAFESHGLEVPGYKVIEKFSSDFSDFKSSVKCSQFPLVVKPAAHGSSVGLSIVDNEDDLDKAVDVAFTFDKKVLIEKYIKGREVTVGILDDKELPVIEIIPKRRFFDYEAKYKSSRTEYIVPAQFNERLYANVRSAALSAHKILGCYGCSRVDIILSEDEKAFVLEVNTIPGFTETSLLPKAAKAAGIDFAQLCITLIRLSYEKAEV